MPESKALLELRDDHVFTLLMQKEDDGNWEGRVIRFPHPRKQSAAWGANCGDICRADSESDLKAQLDTIVDEHNQ